MSSDDTISLKNIQLPDDIERWLEDASADDICRLIEDAVRESPEHPGFRLEPPPDSAPSTSVSPFKLISKGLETVDKAIAQGSGVTLDIESPDGSRMKIAVSPRIDELHPSPPSRKVAGLALMLASLVVLSASTGGGEPAASIADNCLPMSSSSFDNPMLQCEFDSSRAASSKDSNRGRARAAPVR